MAGTYVVLGFVGNRSLLDWMHGGRQPPPHFARLVRGGDPMADEFHKTKYKKEQWPDPDIYQKEGFCGIVARAGKWEGEVRGRRGHCLGDRWTVAPLLGTREGEGGLLNASEPEQQTDAAGLHM